eukprot:636689-Pyramimonas_sp.AAC.1
MTYSAPPAASRSACCGLWQKGSGSWPAVARTLARTLARAAATSMATCCALRAESVSPRSAGREAGKGSER